MCLNLDSTKKKSNVAFLASSVFLLFISRSYIFTVTVDQSKLLSLFSVCVTILLHVSETKGVLLSHRSLTSMKRSSNVSKGFSRGKLRMKIKIVQWRFSEKYFHARKILSTQREASTTQSLSWFPTETWLNNF